MKKSEEKNQKLLDEVIVGYVKPHIYAFTTDTIPNYLKIGDTFRPVSKRLKEWKRVYPDLKEQYEHEAVINDDVYFRDFSVHNYLENDLSKKRLTRNDIRNNEYYSNEFFKDTTLNDIEFAINDIKANYDSNSGKYKYYSSSNRLQKEYHYKREENWTLRPNQKKVVKNFIAAVKKGRTNLLMYAVMRFGKSFTSLCCALEMKANFVLVVSGKADVKDEWKKTVESAGNFKEYRFLESLDLENEEQIITKLLASGEKIVVFLTLQDLQGTKIKSKHKQIFNTEIDLLIVDETHFGARAQSFGAVLNDGIYLKQDFKNLRKFSNEYTNIEDAHKEIKKIKSKVRLHLSGTPYRILMGNEFEKDDIISFVQFSDIFKEKEKWDANNLNKNGVNEWDNPYYGFPQMVRFAFNPSKSAREKMENLKKNGISYSLSKLFETKSIKRDPENGNHKKFKNEKEVLDLLQVIDGSKDDDELLGFLDYDKLKKGNMCKHMVMVLPYCASCDAMEQLLNINKNKFKNINKYNIINISGLDAKKEYKKPSDVKNKIEEYDNKNQKTLTLTVNRMLTGSTVRQWDTMLYFKDTSSPQEYDQAIFRLQNQNVRTLYSDGNNFIKENLKPQTLVVDFEPNRLFRIQEQKALIYNASLGKNGNNELKDKINEELRISPVITMNHNKLRKVEATNVIDAVRDYSNNRSIFDEVQDIPVDLAIIRDKDVLKTILAQGEFNLNKGMTIDSPQDEGDDFDVEGIIETDNNKINNSRQQQTNSSKNIDKEKEKIEEKIKTYYQRILFFAFLTKNKVSSLDDILGVIDKTDDNIRLAKNLVLNKTIVQKITKIMDPFKRSSLDYKIQNISTLATDETIEPLERALISIKKFNRMSESEIITPINICDEMVRLFPKNGIKKIITDGDKLLDIASKSGEYAVALYKRLTSELGYSHDEVYNLIYAIPTSSIAYEFTRKFYEILGLNVDNIITNFYTYDLLEVKSENGKVNYSKISQLLKQNKSFSNITLKDKVIGGRNKVKFGAIIGNPPYNVNDGGAQASSRPIYQNFVLLGKTLSSRFTCFITPTRWFAGGKGLNEFRNLMLNDTSIKELHDYITPRDIFPNINSRGGVCYFLTDSKKKDSDVRVITHKNNEIISCVERPLIANGIDIFIRDYIAVNVIEKIFKSNFSNNLSTIISPRKPFGIESNIIKKNIFHKDPCNLDDPILCIGKNKRKGYVERKVVKSHEKWIGNWKVYVPRANNIGTELSDDNLNSFVGEPNSICTEAYIVVGADRVLNESTAQNLSKYLTTKFVRFLHKQAKASQDATSKTYRFIPLQDFTENSDITWSVPVNEIDDQLFDKYKLSELERNHIKNTIKDM